MCVCVRVNGRCDIDDGFTLSCLCWIVFASVEISACMQIDVYADVTDVVVGDEQC